MVTIKEYLEKQAELNPRNVIGKLEKGSIINKCSGGDYIIDNPDIDKQLGDFPEGTIPYGSIHRTLKNSRRTIDYLFRGSSKVPFSESYKAKVGECLEKAILTQLAAQRGRASFLINGTLGLEGNVGVDFHAFNIVFKEGQPFLIDTQNPLVKDAKGKSINPYIAPVLDITGNCGEVIVPSEWKHGRTYSLS
jgi:hypothetical protein